MSVRLKSEEQKKLKQLCNDAGLSPSAVIRKLILDEEILAKWPDGLKELYLEINRIGVNINQIARKANAGFATKHDMVELRTLMAHIDKLMSELTVR